MEGRRQPAHGAPEELERRVTLISDHASPLDPPAPPGALRTLCVFGTRPEAIKMATVVKALDSDPRFDNSTCVTGQHREMLDQVMDTFSIAPDFDLNVMRRGQEPTDIAAGVLAGMKAVLARARADIVLVQGDTTTSLAAALAAYYHSVPVAHVEAGLRTGNLYAPWPEEGNRRLIAGLAALNFAPTDAARANLLAEGVDAATILVTGNTVIDALFEVVRRLDADAGRRERCARAFPFLRPGSRLVLVTGHRRENFGGGMERICDAVARLARAYPGIDIVYPVHLNPNVREPVGRLLAGRPNVHLVEPQDYLHFVYLMRRCHLVLTDSGGIQEEAPSLGKPVLVMRATTERTEALAAGTVRLVGTDTEAIVSGARRILEDDRAHAAMSVAANPYGDGRATGRIVEALAARGRAARHGA